ncbi:4-hydroxy-tetrahydrodipicolinate synthase [Filimonas lacunae]|uniref:4-hydroxy-tetrahydrodipicolinate synthase n=1 Tax=Filimonas lacunae TaxID=477680 RepID=A0A173MKF9_9BACT|nr:4-hydroxy-tetrahydrodipicolinate synthase [Filimonas lacunae]BAV07891.1 4-hydroxy-tetrahydrodipicolinate synthase [Filimonas lacunae]SIT06071.1 4-hydroxy-tetrahydrodipicolinate synthase [Filimonas lacunae]
MSLRQQLKGTGVALITPFTDTLTVDFEALGRVIDSVIAGGVEYVVTLGTTGETPTLSKKEKLDIVQYTFDKVADRVPVVVGIGGNNTQELIEELKSFPLDKAVAVLSAAPYYSKPSQEGIFQHYKALAEASPKPILLYNVPGRTGRNMSAETTIRLAKEVKNIGGIKEASGDMMQCMQILKEVPEDFLVVSGDDGLAMSQIACGMDGVISVIGNTFPGQFSELVRLSLKNDFVAARAINNSLLTAYDLLFAENNPAGVKAFMTQQGSIGNHLRLPVTPVSDGLYQKIASYLKTI